MRLANALLGAVQMEAMLAENARSSPQSLAFAHHEQLATAGAADDPEKLVGFLRWQALRAPGRKSLAVGAGRVSRCGPMSTRLRAIARDTVSIIERGGYATPAGRWVHLADDVARAVAGTRLYLPGQVLDPAPDTGRDAPAAGPPRIEVTNESTLRAARRLAQDGPEPACLVFASAKNPGGGFLTGAQAQEESLARASALHACLTAVPQFYAYHRAQGDLRYSDRVIYCPGVPVFRDDKGRLLEDSYRVAFLTAAAPNAGAILRLQPQAAVSVPAALRARAARVLEVAAAHGHRRLVLGAWGCGVFRNDPALVAEAFAHALAAYDRFDHVCFAVLDRHPGTPTHIAFTRAFLPGVGW
ncbi:TIGR02452 family protein [Planobispora rosea]|uniref:TIGR02452 family protein n=1 Tax=Planobispora rosea TaxID=35762 RepID=UPI000A778D2D|nr:TIGR02452 family protein [Planobispora rosea]